MILYLFMLSFSKGNLEKRHSSRDKKNLIKDFFDELTAFDNEDDEDEKLDSQKKFKDEVKKMQIEKITKQQTQQKKRNQYQLNKSVRQEPIEEKTVVQPKAELDKSRSLETTSQKHMDETAVLCDLLMDLQDFLHGVSLDCLPISRLDCEFLVEFMSFSHEFFYSRSRHELIVLANRLERIVFKNPGLPDSVVTKIKLMIDYVTFLQTGQKNDDERQENMLKTVNQIERKSVIKLNTLTKMVVYKEIFDKPVSKRIKH